MLDRRAPCVAFPDRLPWIVSGLPSFRRPCCSGRCPRTRPPSPSCGRRALLRRDRNTVSSPRGIAVGGPRGQDGRPPRARGVAAGRFASLAGRDGGRARAPTPSSTSSGDVGAGRGRRLGHRQAPGQTAKSRVSPSKPDTDNAAGEAGDSRHRGPALELSRDRFGGHEARAANPVARPPTAALPQGAVDEPASRRERVGLEVGAAAAHEPGRRRTGALAHRARSAGRAGSWLVVQAALAGLGSRPTVATTAGNARVAQQYGVLGDAIALRADRMALALRRALGRRAAHLGRGPGRRAQAGALRGPMVALCWTGAWGRGCACAVATT